MQDFRIVWGYSSVTMFVQMKAESILHFKVLEFIWTILHPSYKPSYWPKITLVYTIPVCCYGYMCWRQQTGNMQIAMYQMQGISMQTVHKLIIPLLFSTSSLEKVDLQLSEHFLVDHGSILHVGLSVFVKISTNQCTDSRSLHISLLTRVSQMNNSGMYVKVDLSHTSLIMVLWAGSRRLNV